MTADATPAVQSAADRSASVRSASVRSAVVIGGGIAGLACALRLAESGVQVTVLETRRKLGGRATSFTDPRTGEVLDNCQHVLMGCCTNLLDFYERLSVTDAIEWHPRVYWANPPHAPDVMKPGLLPAPAHFTESFATMRMLSLSAKRSVARAMWSMLRMGATGRAQWDGRTFSEFLQETGQSADVVTRFWSPVVVSACNLDVDEVSAAAAMQVFQEGFLANRQAPLMGLSTVPLVRLYDPAEGAILAAGGQVRMGVSALSIAYDGKRVTGVITDEGAFDADVVIGADGSDSTVRRLLNIPIQKIDYQQSALVTVTELTREHKNIAYERFQEQGAIAMLPLKGTSVATIWTAPTVFINELMQLSDLEFLQLLQKQFGYRLGRLKKIHPRATYPLSMQYAEQQKKKNVLLIGNAAHTLHPIAAQGLNSALYEVAVLTEYLAAQNSLKNGLENFQVHYSQQNFSRYLSDGLVKLFSNQSLLPTILRQTGMISFDLCSVAKKKFAHLAMGKTGHVPGLLLRR